MKGMEMLLTGPLAQAIGWALLHLIWQGALVAALLLAVLALLRSRSANARYLASCAALVLLLVLPVITAYRAYEEPLFKNSPPVALRLAHDPIAISQEAAAATIESAAADSAPLTFRDRAREAGAFAAAHFPQILIGWMAGVLLLSLRLLSGWLRANRLAKRNGQPATAQWIASLARLADTMNLTRTIRLLESAAVEVPTVIGWLRPVILLPISTLSGLSREQIEMILAHELAHIRRHDFFVNLLQAMVETLLFYHPAVWWISRRIRVEREHCCDDLAVQVCGNPLQYARALTRLEELRVDAAHAVIAANGGSLLTRIRRLVLARADVPGVPSRWIAGATIVSLFVALLAVPSLPLLAKHADGSAPIPAPTIGSHTEIEVHASQQDESDDVESADDDMTVDVPDVPDAPEPPDPPDAPDVPDMPDVSAPSVAMIWPATPATPPTPPAMPAPPAPAMRGLRVMPAIAPRAVIAPRIAIAEALDSAELARDIAEAVTGGVHGALCDKKISHKIKLSSDGKLSVDDLIALRTQGVDAKYVNEMRGAGLGELSLDDVFSMRVQGVTADYVREMREAGLDVKSPEQIIELRTMGVSSEWIRGMKQAGINKFTTHDLVELRTMGVNGDFIAGMNAAGYSHLSVKDLNSLRAVGVTPKYVEELGAAGYGGLSVDSLIELRTMGVSASFVKSLSEAGYSNLTAKDLVRLAASGINADFVREISKYKEKK